MLYGLPFFVGTFLCARGESDRVIEMESFGVIVRSVSPIILGTIRDSYVLLMSCPSLTTDKTTSSMPLLLSSGTAPIKAHPLEVRGKGNDAFACLFSCCVCVCVALQVQQ